MGRAKCELNTTFQYVGVIKGYAQRRSQILPLENIYTGWQAVMGGRGDIDIEKKPKR